MPPPLGGPLPLLPYGIPAAPLPPCAATPSDVKRKARLGLAVREGYALPLPPPPAAVPAPPTPVLYAAMAAPVRLSRGVPAPEPLPPAGTERPLEERRDMSVALPPAAATAEPALRARPDVPPPPLM